MDALSARSPANGRKSSTAFGRPFDCASAASRWRVAKPLTPNSVDDAGGAGARARRNVDDWYAPIEPGWPRRAESVGRFDLTFDTGLETLMANNDLASAGILWGRKAASELGHEGQGRGSEELPS